MRTTGRIFLALLLVTLLAPPHAAQQDGLSTGGVLSLKVDCDQGDDLRAALKSAAQVGFARIRLAGICDGSYSVYSNNFIELYSEDPLHGAMLRAGAGAALSAFGPGVVQVHDVLMTGATGLHASGESRVVFMYGCEIEAGNFGVLVDTSAAVLVEDTDVRGGLRAIRATDATVVVDSSRLHSDGPVVRAFGSRVHLEDVEVANGNGGVLAHDQSIVTVVRGEFRENGFTHLGAFEDSRLVLYNAQVGADGDPTHVALQVNSGAAVEIYRDDPQTEIWGSANVHGDSYVTFEGAMLNGGINLREFSRLTLDGTVTGGVGCDSAADAWCGPNAHATTVDCASAEQICRPAPPGVGKDRGGQPSIPTIPERPKLLPQPSKRQGLAPQRR